MSEFMETELEKGLTRQVPPQVTLQVEMPEENLIIAGGCNYGKKVSSSADIGKLRSKMEKK